MQKRALITGITGQDGSYLGELLIEKGYEVVGLTRRISSETHWRLTSPMAQSVRLVPGDVVDPHNVEKIVRDFLPHEIYNLAAMSYVGHSWDLPWSTFDINTIGLLNVLEACRKHSRQTRIYQASSSEMFGKVTHSPQNEQTPFHPRSPYGVSKVAAHHLAVNYRESFGMFVSCGILFNHESPRRGLEFVTRKITDNVGRIYDACHGRGYRVRPPDVEPLRLGNVQARRDWGFAGDYVKAMHLMLQQDTPGDYVVATGSMRSVQDFVEAAFNYVGMDWRNFTEINTDENMRPAEVEILLGDPTLALMDLGWEPKVRFDELVAMMVREDIHRYESGAVRG